MIFDDEVEFEDKSNNNADDAGGDKPGHKRVQSQLNTASNFNNNNNDEHKLRQTTSDMISMNDLGAAADGKSADDRTLFMSGVPEPAAEVNVKASWNELLRFESSNQVPMTSWNNLLRDDASAIEDAKQAQAAQL